MQRYSTTLSRVAAILVVLCAVGVAGVRGDKALVEASMSTDSACPSCAPSYPQPRFQCVMGYFVDSMGNCVREPGVCAVLNCITCSGANNNVCTKCEQGYTLTVDGLCLHQAVAGCAVRHCKACSLTNSNVCTTCEQDYTLTDADQCIAKTSGCTVTGCDKCTASNSVCDQCASDYTLTTDGTCVARSASCSVAGCVQCVANTAVRCATCGKDYTRTLDGYCLSDSDAAAAASGPHLSALLAATVAVAAVFILA